MKQKSFYRELYKMESKKFYTIININELTNNRSFHQSS